MSDIYKLQYNGMTLAYPGWNGYVGYEVDPYNPLGLPPFTIRVKFEQGFTPMEESQTLVDAVENVWDITKNSTDWSYLFEYAEENLLEVLGANTTGVTNMRSMFQDCDALTSVALFDTSSCTNMRSMFDWCNFLTSIPLFDTRSCTNMSYMFRYCDHVQSGALALYQQASTQATPPTYHTSTFMECGVETETGAAELEQIPDDWKWG